MKSWMELLAALRTKCAYTGPATLESVKAFLAENKDFIELPKGTSVDSLYTKKVTISVGADAGEDVEVVDATGAADNAGDDAPPPPMSEAKRLKQARSAEALVRGADGERSGLNTGWTPAGQRAMMDRKAYNQRANGELTLNVNRTIATGTVYPDADMAEYAGACIRQALQSVGSIKHYAQAGRDREILQKTSTTFNQTSAGITIPEEVSAGIIYLTEKFGVARKVANVQTMTRDIQRFTRRTGRLTMTHMTEGQGITATDPTYDGVTLTAKEVGCLVAFTNNLLADTAVNIVDDLSRNFAEAQANREDSDYFVGDGTSTYGNHVGLVGGLPSGAYIAQGTGTTWGAQVAADFDGLFGAVENVDPSRLAIVCSRQYAFAVLRRLAQSVGGLNGFERVGGIPNGGPGDAQYLGYPVYFTQVMPTATATSQKCCYVGDFVGATMLGDRKEITIAQSEHYGFNADLTYFRAISRFAVAVHGDGRATTYGPIVGLKTS